MPKAKKTKEVKKPKDEAIICGKSESEIRKAYFKKTLPELLNDIQAEGDYSQDEIMELGNYLQVLKDSEGEAIENICKVFDGEIIEDKRPPSVDELSQGMSDKEWREKADQAIAYIQGTLDAVRKKVARKEKFDRNFWSDTALTFISYQEIIEKDLIYKEQLYRARLTRIIDDNGVSRREAEERARLTQEYFDYKAMDNLAKRLEEFYTFARRKDDDSNRY